LPEALLVIEAGLACALAARGRAVMLWLCAVAAGEILTGMSEGVPQASVSLDQQYVFANVWELARQRLSLLEACHDPTSFRCAAALGVGRGWQCLDAGAGGGSFARWLAERVGEDGRVVAADLDVRLLEDLSAPNVEIRGMDLVHDELPDAAFDFVHARMVLMHIPARDAVLARLVDAVRPGGVLMLEEQDTFPIALAPPGDYADAWAAFVPAMRAAGVDPEWARWLPDRLTAAGLSGVEATVEVQVFRGDSPAARFWSLTWLQARERLVRAGADGALIDRGRAALEDQAGWFYGPAMVIASGHRP
jgi:2-polyprenyl-3-methyl-5-hydroxy-6-metoxy-1,4-benzoquinol methylase